MSCSRGKVNRECEACAQGKMHRIPFPKQSVKKTSQPLELLHSDLCGPMNVDTIGGSKYVLTFTDVIIQDMLQSTLLKVNLKFFQSLKSM